MAKFLKSLFSTSDKKRNSRDDGEDDKNEYVPPMDERRKLSISRSGRMRQNTKNRHALSSDLYGQNDFQTVEKPKKLEYHVNNPMQFAAPERRKSADAKDQVHESKEHNNNRKELTPEEEIETAFDVIDEHL